VSLDVEPGTSSTLFPCEIDFVWFMAQPHKRTAVILGECKDEGPIPLAEFEKDVQHLGQIANALPPQRFETYILFAKLAPFTPDEVRLAENLNDRHHERLILLTPRELEPLHMYEQPRLNASSPESMAANTAKLYSLKESET
jgi:hypothetical protein